MKLRVIALSSLLLTTSVFATEYVKGSIEKMDDHFVIKSGDTLTKIEADEKIMSSIPTLENPLVKQADGKKYTFEFKGDYTDTGFKLDEVPTQVPGDKALTGILEYDLANKTFVINGQSAKYGYTKVLNGYEFDDISRHSFVGKKVLAEGYINNQGIFVMNAVTPAELFTASAAEPAPENIQAKIDEVGAWNFVYRNMNKNEYSQSENNFRVTFYEDEADPVVPGDDFLVITLSGRQGDSFGSYNGHFVAGLGSVRDDMSLRGEVSNAYVYNGKDILSGNVSLTTYFSHTVQGQNQYRPTYTFIAYGIDKQALKDFRDALEPSHIEFRTRKMDITPQFNCTTETVKALAAVGIKGNYKTYDNKYIKGPLASIVGLFTGDLGDTVKYSYGNDASIFQPRPAYNSFAGVFLIDDFRESLKKRLGLKRVDFVYYSQIPSNRPVGGIAFGGLLSGLKYKKLYDKYEVNEDTKLSPEELRPILEDRLNEIK